MICLSFDTDHMSEARMSEFLGTIKFPGQGTFFCTQFYHCLSETEHEIAPHPNLVSGVDWEIELKHKRQEFPLATGWRSHSCVFSHLLAAWLGKNHYKYVSTHDDFGKTSIQPIKHNWGIWHLPIYYMDTLDFSKKDFWQTNDVTPFSKQLIKNTLEKTGLYVFDFHPIHLMLNTPHANFYFENRDAFLAEESTGKLAYKGYGTLNFFMDLCVAMNSKNLKSVAMNNALETHINNSELLADVLA